MQNKATGMSTSASGYSQADIINPHQLDYFQENALYKNGFIKRLVDLLPTESKRAWFKPKEDKTKDNISDESRLEQKCIDYLDKIHNEWKQKTYRDWASVRQCFVEASRIGRKHGDGFILLLVADGRETHEPVDINNIHSFRGMVVTDAEQVQVENYDRVLDPTRPNYYRVRSFFLNDEEQIIKDDAIWHSTRILRFPGTEPDRDVIKENMGYNHSTLQRVIDAFRFWYQTIISGADALKNFNQMVWLADDLLELLQDEQGSERAVKKRLDALQSTMSNLHAVMVDRQREEIQFQTRSLAGMDQVIGRIQDLLKASIDIPLDKAFGDVQASGLNTTNTAGLAARFEWMTCQNTFLENFWLENFLWTATIATRAKDAKVKTTDADELLFEPGAEVPYTKEEELKFDKSRADTDKVIIDSGIYAPEEIRAKREGKPMPKNVKPQRAEGQENPQDQEQQPEENSKNRKQAQEAEAPKRRQDAQNKTILSDTEWDKMAEISAADWVKVADSVAEED